MFGNYALRAKQDKIEKLIDDSRKARLHPGAISVCEHYNYRRDPWGKKVCSSCQRKANKLLRQDNLVRCPQCPSVPGGTIHVTKQGNQTNYSYHKRIECRVCEGRGVLAKGQEPVDPAKGLWDEKDWLLF